VFDSFHVAHPVCRLLVAQNTLLVDSLYHIYSSSLTSWFLVVSHVWLLADTRLQVLVHTWTITLQWQCTNIKLLQWCQCDASVDKDSALTRLGYIATCWHSIDMMWMPYQFKCSLTIMPVQYGSSGMSHCLMQCLPKFKLVSLPESNDGVPKLKVGYLLSGYLASQLYLWKKLEIKMLWLKLLLVTEKGNARSKLEPMEKGLQAVQATMNQK